MSQHSTHSILKQCRCIHSPATLLGPQYWIGVPNKVASWGRNNHGLMRTWLIVINFKMIKMWLYSRCRDSFGLKMLSFGFLHKFVLRTRWLRWSHRMEQKKQTEPGRATNNMSKASLQNCTYYPNSISKVFIGSQVFVKKIILYELACVFERPFRLSHHDVTSKTPHGATTAYKVWKLYWQTQWKPSPAFLISLRVLIISRLWRWPGIPAAHEGLFQRHAPRHVTTRPRPRWRTGGSEASEGWGEGSCRKECSPSRNWFN